MKKNNLTFLLSVLILFLSTGFSNFQHHRRDKQIEDSQLYYQIWSIHDKGYFVWGSGKLKGTMSYTAKQKIIDKWRKLIGEDNKTYGKFINDNFKVFTHDQPEAGPDIIYVMSEYQKQGYKIKHLTIK